jgi:flagellar biosynthetic protein FliR
MDLTLLEGHAIAMLMHLVRAGAFLSVVPFFGRQRDSFFLRLILSVSLGSMFWWNGQHTIAVPSSLVELTVVAAGECLIGFALGFALSLLTAMLSSAGEIVSNEMGFAMARALDPDSGGSSSVVAQLFQIFGFLLVLQLNIHHEALRILQQTFEACPIGEPFRIEPMWLGIQAMVGGGVVCALQYAFPLLAVMLLLTVGLVLFGRAVPNVNLMEFSFTIRVLVAMIAAIYFLSAGTPFLERTFESFLVTTRSMFPV